MKSDKWYILTKNETRNIHHNNGKEIGSSIIEGIFSQSALQQGNI